MKIEKLMLSLVAAAALAACSSTKLDEKPPVETAQPVTQQQTTPTPPPVSERRVETVDLGKQLDEAVANQRVVYFDFDSYVVKDDYRNLIETHAKRLNNKKSLTLRSEERRVGK